MPIPPLAGVTTYARAAKPGFSVEEDVKRFQRYAWIEKRMMDIGLFWLAPTPEWEVKEALALHLSLAAEHAAAIRKRVSEMRNPAPRMDVSPDEALDRFFEEVLSAQDTLEKLVALYGVLRPALLKAYRAHLEQCNPILDNPTRHMLRHILLDDEETAAWGDAAVTAITGDADKERALAWAAHLQAYLQAAGGVSGTEPVPATVPGSRVAGAFEPDFFPRRDKRFARRWTFVNPQRQVSLDESVPLEERSLALMCRRILEMDVPEYLARVIALAQDEPWDYYVDMTRQLWDEARHAMMGTAYFEKRGIAWKDLIAIHPGMSIRLATLAPLDAHTVLFAIEQNLMPAKSGKKLEYEISRSAGDPLAAIIQDFDWADEVLHVHTGRRWLLARLNLSSQEAVKRGLQLRASTVHVLDAYTDRGEQVNWWPQFVHHALGHDTAQREFDLTRQ